VRSVEAAGGDVAVDGDLTVPDAVLGTGSVLDRTGAIASAQAGADLG